MQVRLSTGALASVGEKLFLEIADLYSIQMEPLAAEESGEAGGELQSFTEQQEEPGRSLRIWYPHQVLVSVNGPGFNRTLLQCVT